MHFILESWTSFKKAMYINFFFLVTVPPDVHQDLRNSYIYSNDKILKHKNVYFYL
jgi:hypothetical protein